MASSEARLKSVMVKADATIRQVMVIVNANTYGIALIVDDERNLLNTITDGDLRRAILQGLDLSAPLELLLSTKEPGPALDPITASISASAETQLALMRKHKIRHVPLLDDQQRVAGLALMEDLIPASPPPQAVVMAGGYGTRLHPLTHTVPKPLLTVGNRPIMQRVIEQLQQAGIKQVNVSTHFMGKQIEEFFGDGHKLGVNIDYLTEDRPLGTAGALSLLEQPAEPLLVINGDILTRVDFRALMHFHHDNTAAMTVAVKQYAVQVPYGVVEVDGINILRLTEKPTTSFFIAAGIYLLSPAAWKYLPKGQPCDMPELINRLIEDHCKVVSFPISEYWLDIGQLEDYKNAQKDVTEGQF